MAEIILVVGGCRSGKSAYAQALAESLPAGRVFVATCPVIDDEMRRRVEHHRAARRDRGWETIEEPIDLAGVLRRSDQAGVLLVDCITLWINNLMYAADRDGRPLDETHVADHCRAVLDAAAGMPRHGRAGEQRSGHGHRAGERSGPPLSRPGRPGEPGDRRPRRPRDAGVLRNPVAFERCEPERVTT